MGPTDSEADNPGTDDSGTEEAETNDTENEKNLSYDYFWGIWIRMETGTSLLITDTKAGSDTLTSASAAAISYSGHTLEKQTENTAVLDSHYLYFRKGGANRSFTAKIAGFSDTLDSSIRGIGSGLSALGNIEVIRVNLNNSSDTQEAFSDDSGILSFTDAAPEPIRR